MRKTVFEMWFHGSTLALLAMLTGCGATVNAGDAGNDAPGEASTTCDPHSIGCSQGTPGGTCGDVEVGGVCVNNVATCPTGWIPTSECSCIGGAPPSCVCEGHQWVCPARFSCGNTMCTHGSEYCNVVGDDTGGPTQYACRPIPEQCAAAPTCACIAPPQPGMDCAQSSDGDVTVTFLGG